MFNELLNYPERKKILIIGRGILAKYLEELFRKNTHCIDYEVVKSTHLLGPTLNKLIEWSDSIIYTSFITNVDKNEEEPFTCFNTNIRPLNDWLALIPETKRFIYVSSIYAELRGNSKTNYGRQKRMAELLIEQRKGLNIIIRTHDIISKERHYAYDKAPTNLITRPVYVRDLARWITHLAMTSSNKIKNVGTITLLGWERINRFKLSQLFNPATRPCKLENVDFKAKRMSVGDSYQTGVIEDRMKNLDFYPTPIMAIVHDMRRRGEIE